MIYQQNNDFSCWIFSGGGTDWDLATPGLREAWDAGDYSKFHGWDRRSAESMPTSYQ